MHVILTNRSATNLDPVQRSAIRLIDDLALTCHLQPLSHRRGVLLATSHPSTDTETDSGPLELPSKLLLLTSKRSFFIHHELRCNNIEQPTSRHHWFRTASTKDTHPLQINLVNKNMENAETLQATNHMSKSFNKDRTEVKQKISHMQEVLSSMSSPDYIEYNKLPATELD
nr:unnamed protein product [Callosobruchus chinensis]